MYKERCVYCHWSNPSILTSQPFVVVSNSEVKIFICSSFAFGFFQASHQFPLQLHRATQILVFHDADLFYNTDTKRIQTKVKSE